MRFPFLDILGLTARGQSRVRKTGNRTTVRNPKRKMYPEVYRDPSVIVDESARQIAPEDPLLQELFGVSRADLDDLARARYESGATLKPQEVFIPAKGGPVYIDDLLTPANTQRVQDVVQLAATDPRYAGSFGWYENQPLLDKFIAELGPQKGAEEWRAFHAIGAGFSPGSAVDQEIRRASLANMWRRQGRGAEFLDPGAPPAGAGHAYHTTAHQMARDPLEGLLFAPDPKGSPKVSKYYTARLGENMDVPVGDAHWGRMIGLPDVRTAKSGLGGSPGSGEFYPMQEWYRERVATPIGVPSVPAQALQWGAGASSTGVETAIGAPFLELLARGVRNMAERTKKTPQTVLDDFITGKGHLWGAGAGAFGMGAMAPGGDVYAAAQEAELDSARYKQIAQEYGIARPSRSWAGEMADKLERVKTPGGLFDPTAIARYLRDIETGNRSGLSTYLLGAMELTDPVTLGISAGSLLR